MYSLPRPPALRFAIGHVLRAATGGVRKEQPKRSKHLALSRLGSALEPAANHGIGSAISWTMDLLEHHRDALQSFCLLQKAIGVFQDSCSSTFILWML